MIIDTSLRMSVCVALAYLSVQKNMAVKDGLPCILSLTVIFDGLTLMDPHFCTMTDQDGLTLMDPQDILQGPRTHSHEVQLHRM